MTPISRRKMLAALAVTGASTLGARRMLSASASTPAAAARVLSAEAREQATRKLLDYFTRTAPQLL